MTRRIAIGTIVIAIAMLIVGLIGVGYVNRLLQTQAQDECSGKPKLPAGS